MDTGRRIRLFGSGGNQVVRIPRDLELPGRDAILRRAGDRPIIEPAPPSRLADVLKAPAPLDETVPDIGDPVPGPVDLRPQGRLSFRKTLDKTVPSDLVRRPRGGAAWRITAA